MSREKIEPLTPGQAGLLESVRANGEQTAPDLPSGVTDLGEFKQRQFSELQQNDPSRMSNLMRRSGATAILCTIKLPQVLHDKITTLLFDDSATPDAPREIDDPAEFTSQELRFGKFVYGCVLGMSAPELEQYMLVARRIDQWDGKTMAPFPADADGGVAQSENGAVFRFALDNFAVGALNEIRRQTTTSLSDVDIITLAIENSLDNNAILEHSNARHTPIPVAKEAKADPNKCTMFTLYMDEYNIKLTEGFALTDCTGMADQIRTALTYVLANEPSMFTLQSMAQSPNLTKGRPVTVLIDTSTYNELRHAGFTDKQISRLLSAAMFTYFDARLNDPDLEQKMADASVVHDALLIMLNREKALGRAKKEIVDKMIKRHQAAGNELDKAILMAHEEYSKRHGPKVLTFHQKNSSTQFGKH